MEIVIGYIPPKQAEKPAKVVVVENNEPKAEKPKKESAKAKKGVR